MAATVNPSDASAVFVTELSEYYRAELMVDAAFTDLALGLGALALLVGGIGIANTMVVAAMERRAEIGLRRAIGARPGQIVLQFMLEAAFIALVGGLVGVAMGCYATFLNSAANQIAFAIPPWVLLAGPSLSVLIGVLAGCYPALKAAKVPPTVALRAF
jgi:putative ABC transport system permease protein